VLAERASAASLRARTEEMRSSLLAAVSHDLRTPLAAITGAATSLRDVSQLGRETASELIESICDGAERLDRLVANLLSMTRLESREVSLRREWVPVGEIVGSALAVVDKLVAKREVSVSIDPDLPLLHVDPLLIEQLLVNLLENAVRYAPNSAIELSARRLTNEVELSVSDRGPGLPPEVSTRAFQKFVRGAGARGPGVGLGLAICDSIAAAHGGSLIAEPRSGGGTTFRVALPAAEAPPLASSATGGAT
jgi:two-component system sensor histidine kinase KdpD